MMKVVVGQRRIRKLSEEICDINEKKIGAEGYD